MNKILITGANGYIGRHVINELINLKSIRAIRANDTEYLEMYEAQAQTLRVQLAELGIENLVE